MMRLQHPTIATWHCLLAATLIPLCGACTTTTQYTTEVQLHTEQVSDLWSTPNYRYVQTALTGSASAASDSPEARFLARNAMNKLVETAQLKANQALVHVTMERGTTTVGEQQFSVVTMRGDVVEITHNSEVTP